MTRTLTATLGSSLLALSLFIGVAEAARGSSPGPTFKPSTPAASERRVPETKTFKTAPAIARPIKIAPKLDPRVTTRIQDLKPKLEKLQTRTPNPEAKIARLDAKAKGTLAAAAKVKPLQPQLAAAKLAAGSVAAAKLQQTALHSARLPLAPVTDKSNRVTQKAMDSFVASHVIQRTATTLTKADGAKHQAAVTLATTLIKDASKGYQVAKYGDPKKPAGDHGTIVINENNKTVYVPASTVAGPDRRTIIVNCNNCKVVIVGNNGQNVVDERKIIVNGNNDKIVLQGSTSNGGNGQAGGSVVDNRQVVVNGNGDKIKLQGDQADGGKGANGQGQAGGAGGYVDDNRNVTVNGNGAKVDLGKDSANGGDGGRGGERGGDGGKGGKVDDDRTVVANGNGTKVANAGASADGGNGGTGRTAGGNGGDGGDIKVGGSVVDNGHGTVSRLGDYSADGGNGGSGRRP